jgi:hypothetical protein
MMLLLLAAASGSLLQSLVLTAVVFPIFVGLVWWV